MSESKYPKLKGEHRSMCTACGETFGRTSLFDKHRVGAFGVNRRCLSADEMRGKEWRLNGAGVWVGPPRVFTNNEAGTTNEQE